MSGKWLILSTTRGCEDAKTNPQCPPFPSTGDQRSTQGLNSTFGYPQMRCRRPRDCKKRSAGGFRASEQRVWVFSVKKHLLWCNLSLLEAPVPHSPAHRWLHVLEEVLWLTGVFQGFQIPIRATLPRCRLRGQARPANKKQRDVRQIWKQI